MPAFNRRIRPKEYYGISAWAFIFFIVGFMLTSFCFIPRFWAHVVFPMPALASYILSFISFIKHKDALFLAVISESKRDLKCRPAEAIEQW